MGNQNTSGIIEERAANEAAVEKGQNVNSGDELGKDCKEDESKNLQLENAGPGFNCGIQVDQSCPIENLKEEANGEDDDNSETQMDTLPSGLNSTIETKESTLEEGVSVLNNGMNDPSCKSQGGTWKNGTALEMEPKDTSSITNSRSLPHEDLALELKTDQSVEVEEIQEGQEFKNACQTQAESNKVDTKITQDMNTSRVADHEIDKSEDGCIVSVSASDEEAQLETHMDDITNDVSDARGKGGEDIHGDPSKLSWKYSCSGEDEKCNEFLTQGEEKQMLEEEISEALNMSIDQQDQAEMVESDLKSWDGDKPVVQEGSISHDEKNPKDEQADDESLKIKHEDPDQVPDQTEEGSTVTDKNKEDNQPPDEDIIEHDTVITSIEKRQVLLESQSSIEINVDPTQLEPTLHEGLVSNKIPEPKIPPYSTAETSQGLDFEPKPRDIDIGIQVLQRKSPSFDFGIVPYDARSEESDQTPLLYNDRSAAPRRFSSCSTLGFQSRSVQTEYTENLLQYEAVEVEEKTIRMERSNSESLGVKAMTLPNNDEKVNAIVKATQEDCNLVLPKGTRKKKARSSLFTTCICCTEAIG